MFTKLTRSAAALAAAAVAFSAPAAAAFPEKNITFIIPYRTGGGFDVYVRQLSPLLEKHFGGKVNVVPRNVDAAGGRKALTDLWRAKPDGYTIAIFNMPGMLLDKILDKPTSYEIDKFTWLAQLSRSPYTLAVSTKGPHQDVKALQSAKGLKYAITSPASTAYVAGKIMASALGMDVTFLPGYKGSSAIQLSIIRGDTQLSLFANESYAKYAQSGDMKAVLSFEDKSPWPGVPTVGDIGKPELTALATERIVGGPPGMPKDIVKTLSDAIVASMNSADAQKWKIPRHPANAEAAAKRVNHLVDFYGKYKKVLAAK
ncbi:MAG: hypothetical protein RLZ98_914 [Pseudomonadota bacterium]|jgi:tripartite-type tricarboxylate transporter receptor subunit TctC